MATEPMASLWADKAALADDSDNEEAQLLQVDWEAPPMSAIMQRMRYESHRATPDPDYASSDDEVEYLEPITVAPDDSAPGVMSRRASRRTTTSAVASRPRSASSDHEDAAPSVLPVAVPMAEDATHAAFTWRQQTFRVGDMVWTAADFDHRRSVVVPSTYIIYRIEGIRAWPKTQLFEVRVRALVPLGHPRRTAAALLAAADGDADRAFDGLAAMYALGLDATGATSKITPEQIKGRVTVVASRAAWDAHWAAAREALRHALAAPHADWRSLYLPASPRGVWWCGYARVRDTVFPGAAGMPADMGRRRRPAGAWSTLPGIDAAADGAVSMRGTRWVPLVSAATAVDTSAAALRGPVLIAARPQPIDRDALPDRLAALCPAAPTPIATTSRRRSPAASPVPAAAVAKPAAKPTAKPTRGRGRGRGSGQPRSTRSTRLPAARDALASEAEVSDSGSETDTDDGDAAPASADEDDELESESSEASESESESESSEDESDEDVVRAPRRYRRRMAAAAKAQATPRSRAKARAKAKMGAKRRLGRPAASGAVKRSRLSHVTLPLRAEPLPDDDALASGDDADAADAPADDGTNPFWVAPSRSAPSSRAAAAAGPAAGGGPKARTVQRIRRALHARAAPANLPCRENEYTEIYTFLYDHLVETTSGCMYISGVPGTGKTATVTEAVRALRRAYAEEVAALSAAEQAALREANGGVDDDECFQYVELNGMRLADPSRAYSELWAALHDGQRLSPRHAQQKLSDEFTLAARTGGPPRARATVVLVDELDLLLTKRQDILYHFMDWPQYVGSRLIVLAVANTMDLLERHLSSRVSSRMGLARLVFQPYTHDQLQTILIHRLESAAADNATVFGTRALELCARRISAVSGDARRALDICRIALELFTRDRDRGTRLACRCVKDGATAAAAAGSGAAFDPARLPLCMHYIDKAIQGLMASPVVVALARVTSITDKCLLVAAARALRTAGATGDGVARGNGATVTLHALLEAWERLAHEIGTDAAALPYGVRMAAVGRLAALRLLRLAGGPLGTGRQFGVHGAVNTMLGAPKQAVLLGVAEADLLTVLTRTVRDGVSMELKLPKGMARPSRAVIEMEHARRKEDLRITELLIKALTV